MKSQVKSETRPAGADLDTERIGFLSTHALVLLHLAGNPGRRVRDIALDLDLTERTVYRLLSELEAAGYIDRERDGRRFGARINRELPLRTPLRSDPTVAQLLALIDT